MRRLARFSVAVGGFLIMLSLILTCILLLILLGILDLSSLTTRTSNLLLAAIFIAIAASDFIAGVILLRR